MSPSPAVAAQSSPGFPAFGTLIQVLSSTSPSEDYTTIENAGDITGPGNALAEVDVTSHSSGAPIKQTVPGLIDLGDISFPCYWNPQAPTQSPTSPFGLEYLFFNRITTKFRLINTDTGHRTRVFSGFVKTLAENAKVTGVMERQVAIRITTPWVDTASPISLSPASVTSVPQAGAPSGTFQVKAGGSATPWTCIPDQSWITVTTPTGPTTGDASVTYAVAVNSSGSPRTGKILITGLNLEFDISQS